MVYKIYAVVGSKLFVYYYTTRGYVLGIFEAQKKTV